MAYPGELARIACAKRTRDELIEYGPKRPLALRDELRIRGMYDRCSTCRACPLTIRALEIMRPPSLEPTSAVVLKLAG